MWRRTRGNGDARDRARQEALLRAAEKMTPLIERMADHLADLPVDEFAARVRDALTVQRR